ncbi:MAG: hypothetical protein M3305_11350, partial [Actinomycetota bacterium]|nr:hypothetical protein [Actinomycetota bacterium]
PDTAATGTYPDDQWFPWIDSNPLGGLTAAATMDGNAHDGFPARETYGYSLWIGGAATGTPDFESGGNLSGAPSQPRQSRFFRTATVDPENSCPDCTRFIGDYNGIAVDKEGNIHGVWTDMRRTVETVERPIGCDSDPATPPCTPVGLKAQDAYYAQRPVTPVGATFGR